jgi:hydroxymethylglutaryl-CoA synthase
LFIADAAFVVSSCQPHLTSPYPVVDGKFSNSCYLRSLDICFEKFASKFAAREKHPFSVVKDADYVLFHAPYNKLVQKSFARLMYNESLLHPETESLASLKQFASVQKDKSYEDVALEKAAVAASKQWYGAKVTPGISIPQLLGNMYTASLYAGLMSLVSNEREKLAGKRLLMFSYGSGLAASMFALKVGQSQAVKDRLNLIAQTADIDARLDARTAVQPEVFNHWMGVREKLHTVEGPYQLKGATDEKELFPGAYFLVERDDKGRRKYQQLQQ